MTEAAAAGFGCFSGSASWGEGVAEEEEEELEELEGLWMLFPMTVVDAGLLLSLLLAETEEDFCPPLLLRGRGLE